MRTCLKTKQKQQNLSDLPPPPAQLFLLSPFLCLLHRTTLQPRGLFSSALSSNSLILSSLAPPLFESIHLVFETASLGYHLHTLKDAIHTPLKSPTASIHLQVLMSSVTQP